MLLFWLHIQAYIYGRQIKLLDNVKIHNAKLFKCYLEDSNIFIFNIPSYCTTLSVVGKFITINQAKNKKV